ncbi:MAG: glutathione S-transferase family protein, partial [Myxococcales bacterium]
MKLYSSRVAPNPHKIRLAIAELGIPCEVVEIDLKDRPNRRPPFTTTLNPNGHLPVIDDDGFVLWESDAILAYLGRKHADRGLWPTGLKEEADALRWLLYELATLQPPVADVWWEKWLRPKL